VRQDAAVENPKDALEVLSQLPPEVEEEDYEEDELVSDT
jgi:hypothetical protein